MNIYIQGEAGFKHRTVQPVAALNTSTTLTG